jgi:methanethiol S-methyltransferase
MPVMAILTHSIGRNGRPSRPDATAGLARVPISSRVVIAWAGGAAFLVSLLYLSYFWVVILAAHDGDPADRVVSVMINAALFSAFALHHSVLARARAKHLVARVIDPRLERAVYVWTASVLAIAMCAFWQPVAGLLYAREGPAQVPFWALQALGAGVIIGAVRVIDPLELAGIRQAASQPAARALRIVGPFRVVRHPIYLGWMLLVFGTPTMTANRLLFAAISSLYLILAIPWEESSLVVDHGDRYREYQRLVRWRVIPGIW